MPELIEHVACQWSVWIDLTKGQEATGGKKPETFIGKIHWKSQNKYFVNVLHFLNLLLYFFGHLCHFLSFWKMEKIFKNDYHVAAQIQGTSAEKSWKAGRRRSGQGSLLRELWWACLDEELPSGLECRADSKTGWEGRTLGEMAHGEAVRVREAPRLQKCNFTSTLAHESNKYFFLCCGRYRSEARS